MSKEYLIQKTTLDNIAKQSMNLAGKTEAVTPDEIIADLTNTNTEVNTQADLIAQITEALGGKAISGGGGGSEETWIGDGNTHIWISLAEGRTSPMLGVCPNGTVTVDWGDGTTPNTLTGTSTSTVVWTPTHNYATAGDYVITLTVDGEMAFRALGISGSSAGLLCQSSATDERNNSYKNAIQKIEIGNGITGIDIYAFSSCYSLASINIPDGVTRIGNYAFYHCYSLTRVNIPDSVTSIGEAAFNNCYSLASINIPDGVTIINTGAIQACVSLTRVNIPDSVTSIRNNAFIGCYSLANINISDNIAGIGNNAFNSCYSLSKIRFNSTTPPPVASGNAFTDIPTDCIISVPVGSLEAYTTATNYPSSSTYTYIEED